MIDGRTVGEVSETSRSAVEVANLWAYLDDRLMRMRSDGSRDLLDRPPRSTFEADILSPATAGMSGQEVDEDEEALENQPGYALAGSAPPPAAPSANSNWDGVERRQADAGPPPGKADRRRVPHQPFGRRFTA